MGSDLVIKFGEYEPFETSESKVFKLKTAGKYMKGDLEVTYTKPSSSGGNQLPEAYQEVEWIESVGNNGVGGKQSTGQYIKTGVTHTNALSVEMKLCATTYAANNGLWYNNTRFNIVADSYLQYMYGDGGATFYGHVPSERYVPQTVFIGSGSQKIDGVEYSTLISNSNSGGEFTLFCRYESWGTSTNMGCQRLYYCKMWEGTNLIRDFVPCYRKADYKPGLYDLVNDAFYTNAGTQDFLISGGSPST